MRPSELAQLLAAVFKAADHPEVQSVETSSRPGGSLTVNVKFTDGSAAHSMVTFRADGPGGRKLPYKDYELPKEMW